MRPCIAILLAAFAAAAGLTFAQPPAEQPEPPVRLQKKGKPLPDVPRTDELEKRLVPEGKKSDEPPREERRQTRPGEKPDSDVPAPEGEDEKEIALRVAKNMRTAEDRLANQELGDKIQPLQRDILKDLDALIARQEQPPPPQQSQQQSSSSSDSSSGSSESSSRDQSRARQQANQGSRQDSSRQRSQQGQSRQSGRRNPPGQPQESQQRPGAQGGQPAGGMPNQNPRAQAEPPNGELRPLPPTDNTKSIWGHLPEAKRAEMDAYAREKFMTKYKDLINQYYATLAEKSRQKGD
jgi:hypothetical protein